MRKSIALAVVLKHGATCVRLALLALALLSPGAAAHATVSEEQQSAVVDGWFLYFATAPPVVYAGKDYLATLAVNHPDFRPGAGLNVTLDDEGREHAAAEAYAGTYSVSLRAEAPGERTLAWSVGGPNGTSRWEAKVPVYPDLGVSVLPADPLQDVFANETTEFGVTIVNRTTGLPDERVADVTLRVERWTDDHRTMLDAREIATVEREGAWFAELVFAKGMAHVRVASASLGMGYDDAPYIHLYVVEALPPAPGEPERPTPAAPLAGAGAALAAALARRRA